MARSRWRVWWSKTHDGSLRRICSVHDPRFGANSHAILSTHVSLGRTSVPARALEGVEVMSSADPAHSNLGRTGYPARCPRTATLFVVHPDSSIHHDRHLERRADRRTLSCV